MGTYMRSTFGMVGFQFYIEETFCFKLKLFFIELGWNYSFLTEIFRETLRCCQEEGEIPCNTKNFTSKNQNMFYYAMLQPIIYLLFMLLHDKIA